METYDSPGAGGLMALGAGFFLFFFAIWIFSVICGWKIYTKAGKPGWAAIIPIYNIIVLLEIVGKPIWWIFLLLIPFVGFIIAIILIHRLSLSFGQGIGMTLLLLIVSPVGAAILAFGSATYIGPPAN